MDEDAMCREKKHRKQCLGKDNEFSFRCVENEVSVSIKTELPCRKLKKGLEISGRSGLRIGNCEPLACRWSLKL